MGVSENNTTNNQQQQQAIVAGIPLRSPLKPVFTKPSVDLNHRRSTEREDCDSITTTPKGMESRIPPPTTCPPAPRKKRKAYSRISWNRDSGAVIREFFNPPDLETLFTSISRELHKDNH